MNNCLITVYMEIIYGVDGGPYSGLTCELYNYKVAKLNVVKENLAIKFHSIYLEGVQIFLAKGAKEKEIMQAFEQRKSEIQNGAWKKDWFKFCEVEKENYDCDYEKYIKVYI